MAGKYKSAERFVFAINGGAADRLGLTPTMQINLLLLANGFTQKEMAEKRGVSYSTIKNQLSGYWEKSSTGHRHRYRGLYDSLEEILGKRPGPDWQWIGPTIKRDIIVPRATRYQPLESSKVDQIKLVRVKNRHRI